MFQTKILTNFDKYIRNRKIHQIEEFIADCNITVATLKLQGKTDGILTYDPPLEMLTTNRYVLRTWIDFSAAEEWMVLRNALCVKYNIDITPFEIIEIV